MNKNFNFLSYFGIFKIVQENKELKSELAKLQADLTLDNQHISQLEGSLEALQIANDSLKERVSKLSRSNSEIARRSQMLDENSTSQRWLVRCYFF